MHRNAGARYRGVTHEYLEVPGGGSEQLFGIWYNDYASGSNRVDKFERDIRLLEEALKGEPDKFEVHHNPKTGETITYARVYLVDNLARAGRVLLAAGQSVSATEMAGEFLLRDDSGAKVRAMAALPPGGALPDMEMVLQVSEQNEIGNRVELVAARKIARHYD